MVFAQRGHDPIKLCGLAVTVIEPNLGFEASFTGQEFVTDDYKLKIPLNGEGPIIAVDSWDALDKWIEAERVAWNWLLPQNDTNIAGIADHVQLHLANIHSLSKSYQANGQHLSTVAGSISEIFNGSRGPVLPSASLAGQAVIDVRQLAGDEGAAAAYAFAIGKISFANVSNRRQLSGILASTFPAFEETSALADRLAKERANTKSSAREFTSELRQKDDQREVRWHELLKRVGRIGRRTLRQRRTLWSEQQRNLALQQTEAINEIRAVQTAFEEAMHLQAPVKYWQDKAKKHETAEGKAIVRLRWFFPVGAFSLGIAFWFAGSFILKDAQNPALFVVVSGGLAI